jgi:hypothetical protein
MKTKERKKADTNKKMCHPFFSIQKLISFFICFNFCLKYQINGGYINKYTRLRRWMNKKQQKEQQRETKNPKYHIFAANFVTYCDGMLKKSLW